MSTEVPEGWEERTLGSCALYINGYAFKPEDWHEFGTPIIRIQQLHDADAHHDFCPRDLPDKFCINNGDLVFSWSATLSLKIWDRGKAFLNQHLYKVIAKNGVDKIFLKYLVEFNLDRLAGETHGSTMKHITRPHLLEYRVTLPKSISEQKKIALILQSIDNDIDKTRELIEKHRKMRQGLMQDLFARGVDESGSLRKEGIWDKLQIRSVAFVADIDHKMPEDVDFGVPFISSKDITEDGDIVMQGVKQISENDYKRLARKIKPKKGDIIYSRIGTIGRVALVKRHVKFLMSYSCCVIRKKDRKIESSYLAHVLRSQEIERQILRETQSIGVPDLGLDKIYDFEILLPRDRNEQQRIARRVDALDLKAKAEQSYLSKLLKMKIGLMQDLLTGKVRVAA